MSEVAAVLRGARLSAQKARLVADSIRGKNVGEALNILSFSNKKGADIIKKVLESSIANVDHNCSVDVDVLQVFIVYVNEGMTRKRIVPRARGLADRIMKGTCQHLVDVPKL